MSERPKNLILPFLRRIDERIERLESRLERIEQRLEIADA
jgi:hypothetical protein